MAQLLGLLGVSRAGLRVERLHRRNDLVLVRDALDERGVLVRDDLVLVRDARAQLGH